jgi:hypothetical protein
MYMYHQGLQYIPAQKTDTELKSVHRPGRITILIEAIRSHVTVRFSHWPLDSLLL